MTLVNEKLGVYNTPKESDMVIIKIIADGKVSKNYFPQPEPKNNITIYPWSLCKMSEKYYAVKGNYAGLSGSKEYRLGIFQLPQNETE